MTLVVVLALTSAAWVLLGLAAVARSQARPSVLASSTTAGLPSVTVLKPLAGADHALEANLESTFRQSYPHFEVVLGVETDDDPALVVARRVAARFPNVASRVVVTKGHAAANPKVRKLLGMFPHARHDLVVISDSNVRVAAHYLADLVATRLESGAGLVTSLIVGTGETDMGSALDCAQMNGFCTPGSCLPTLLGSAAVIGKSMFFSVSELERLGGLAKVRDVLAEDFVLGKMYEHGGLRVAVARLPVASVAGPTSLASFVARQRRWAAMRWRNTPAAFLLEGMVNPLVLLALAGVADGVRGMGALFPWLLALALVRDMGGWVLLRGTANVWVTAAVLPLKEVLAIAAYLSAPFARTLTWRGRVLRLGAGSILYATSGEDGWQARDHRNEHVAGAPAQ